MITIFTSGNVGADAELQVTPKGKAVANFRLGARNRKGETEWLRCQLWGDRAEKLCPFLKKLDHLPASSRLLALSQCGSRLCAVPARNGGQRSRRNFRRVAADRALALP